MRNFFIFLVLVIVGGKYGLQYLTSSQFQDYGDRTKAPWTCQANNIMGHLQILLSNYDSAISLFNKTVARCPSTEMSEVGQFEIAECLSKLNRNREAVEAYRAFAEKYPGTKRARIALRAAEILHTS